MNLMYSAGVARHQHRDAVDPTAFLQLAGHPLRWRLLGELARSDRQVQELTAWSISPRTSSPTTWASCATAGLVSARRSSADGRDAYYTLDLDPLRRAARRRPAGRCTPACG